MAWNGVYRRLADSGKESPEILLARIDENIQFLKTGAEVVRIQLDQHEKDDHATFKEHDNKLDEIRRTIWMVSGAACVIVTMINFITPIVLTILKK